MNEKKQIERAALLEDTQPAREIDTTRAKEFVSSVLEKDKTSNKGILDFLLCHKGYVWGTSAALVAAGVAIVLFVNTPRHATDSYGVPGQIYESTSIHAATSSVDSVKTETTDSLTISTIHEDR